MKKLLAIILLFSFALMVPIKPLALSVYQQFWKIHIYQMVKSEIKSNHVLELTFSKKDIKNDKLDLKFIGTNEFCLNGMMFDIKSSHQTDDSITYSCFRDIKESILIASIHNAFTHSGNFEQTLPNEIIKLLKTLNFDNFTLSNLTIKISKKLISPIVLIIDKFPSFIEGIPTPPPKNKILNFRF